MSHFTFVSCDNLNLSDFETPASFVRAFPDCQSIFLETESQLELLLNILGIETWETQEIDNQYFALYLDYSPQKLPEFNRDDSFEDFYQNWISLSGRENTMDEFGSLIFLKGMEPIWNARRYRLVVKER